MERAPGSMGELVSSHRNSERELTTIERVRNGEFAGRLILCIYDDEGLGTIAPTLLDDGMLRWLAEQIDAVEKHPCVWCGETCVDENGSRCQACDGTGSITWERIVWCGGEDRYAYLTAPPVLSTLDRLEQGAEFVREATEAISR